METEEKPLSYEEFRTGYTFCDIYYMIYGRKHKRRRGVLGFWRQLKLQMYEEYLANFHSGVSYTPTDDPIPF